MSEKPEMPSLIVALAQSAAAASDLAERCEVESFAAQNAGDSVGVIYCESSEQEARDTCQGLKSALTYLRAESTDDAVIQLCAARELVEHLAALSCGEDADTASDLRASIDRLVTSAVLALEQQSGRKLEDLGLWRARGRRLDKWATPAERIAAIRKTAGP